MDDITGTSMDAIFIHINVVDNVEKGAAFRNYNNPFKGHALLHIK